jgi:hypothetical protein
MPIRTRKLRRCFGWSLLEMPKVQDVSTHDSGKPSFSISEEINEFLYYIAFFCFSRGNLAFLR